MRRLFALGGIADRDRFAMMSGRVSAIISDLAAIGPRLVIGRVPISSTVAELMRRSADTGPEVPPDLTATAVDQCLGRRSATLQMEQAADASPRVPRSDGSRRNF